MPSLEAIIAVILAGLALGMTPGPSMLYVLSRSVGQSRAAGFASAFGLGLGGCLLAIASAGGLAVLLSNSDWLVSALTYAGAAYIAWLGIGMIRNAITGFGSSFDVSTIPHEPLGRIVIQGIVVEVLNPKTVLFFALFLPPFLDASSDGSIPLQLLILGILVPLTAVPADMIAATVGGSLVGMVKKNHRIRQSLSITSGIVLLVIALNLLIGWI